MSILSATEARKSVISKRITKGAVLKLDSDEPWDTVQAQLLVKIDQVLHPSLIKYEHYDVTFSIPRVYPKPGLSLNSAVDYDLIVKRHNPKAFTVNIMVVQLRLDDDKENEAKIELAKERQLRNQYEMLSPSMKFTHIFCRQEKTLQHFPETSTRIDISKSSVTNINA